MWKAFYDSPLWIPSIPVLVAAVLIVVVHLPRARPARTYATVFAVLIALDAWLNGALTPLAADSGWATAAAVTFVIVGDLRYFFAQRRYAGVAWPKALPRALALALLVPIGTQIGVRLPFPGVSARILFLIYECAMVLVVCVDWRRHRHEHSGSLARFELAQYGAWVVADVLLLSGVEAAYALRVVPNLLYYAAFVPFAWRVLSARERPLRLQPAA